jgi:hypothetical protein
VFERTTVLNACVFVSLFLCKTECHEIWPETWMHLGLRKKTQTSTSTTLVVFVGAQKQKILNASKETSSRSSKESALETANSWAWAAAGHVKWCKLCDGTPAPEADVWHEVLELPRYGMQGLPK